MSEESIKPPSSTDKSFYPEVIGLYDIKPELKFRVMRLKRTSASFLHEIYNKLFTN